MARCGYEYLSCVDAVVGSTAAATSLVMTQHLRTQFAVLIGQRVDGVLRRAELSLKAVEQRDLVVVLPQLCVHRARDVIVVVVIRQLAADVTVVAALRVTCCCCGGGITVNFFQRSQSALASTHL